MLSTSSAFGWKGKSSKYEIFSNKSPKRKRRKLKDYTRKIFDENVNVFEKIVRKRGYGERKALSFYNDKINTVKFASKTDPL